LAERRICPICNKRRAERYCPAMGEKICAVDCGTEREVSIDCPPDCPYLHAAHSWERAHPKPLSQADIPFSEVAITDDLIYARQVILAGLGHAVLVYAVEQRSLRDAEVLAAVQALGETYRTLLAGIYYEKAPQNPVSAGLYAALAKFIVEAKRRSSEEPGFPPLKDSEIFQLLVFFLRFGHLQSNGRPLTRSFLSHLRSQFPAELGVPKEEPRIVIP